MIIIIMDTFFWENGNSKSHIDSLIDHLYANALH